MAAAVRSTTKGKDGQVYEVPGFTSRASSTNHLCKFLVLFFTLYSRGPKAVWNKKEQEVQLLLSWNFTWVKGFRKVAVRAVIEIFC